ncbi:MAG: glycosyltransferase family 9 protein [Candidatus Scalindua sp.]|nr:glycosyltransferase family 9 protein [Candidatus Scalindua sp.]
MQTLPTIYALRKNFPDAYLEIMGYVPIAELAKGKYYADAISNFDQRGISYFFRDPELSYQETELAKSLRDYFSSFDVIFLFLRSSGKDFYENLKRIKGPEIILFDPFPPDGERVHIVDHLLESVKQLDLKISRRIPRIFLQDDDIDFAAQFIENHDLEREGNKRIVAIHPGSGSRKKCWEVEKFAEFIHLLRKRMAVTILIVSGPADRENITILLNKIRNLLVIPDMSITKVAAVLKKCSLYVGNDSGITHISAAVLTPTIAIFGPTDPAIWGVRGKSVRMVKSTVPCAPCSADERNLCKQQVCFEGITVEDVFAAVNSILS